MSALPYRVARLRSADGFKFAVLVELPDGVEVETFSSTVRAEVDGWTHWLEHRPPFPPHAAQMLRIYVGLIMRLAEMIAGAGDQQGTADYATKAHMRAWAREILELAVTAKEVSEPVASHPPPRQELAQ